MEYVAVACRILIGVVFLAAVVGKLSGGSAYQAFVQSLRRMKVIPSRWAGPVAAASVTAEIAIVILVLTPLWTAGRIGLALAAVVLAAFAGAIALSLRRGNNAPCQCFGRTAAPLGWHHVARNTFLIAVAVVGLLSAGGPLNLAATLAPAVAGLVIGGLVVMLDDIVYLFKPASRP
ncbi:MauE/DoxX family redox-associated membrane protein [Allorhizocola rhizosphaerae]|uniref:MauE/DoxX family redox-associated membrane protein n=1 Tax=Allorhizocola rhizosphaerae TaxID=1872709 RepID=UPI000E3D0B4A|nr:MauE/DoxX family redox-associated membrane protein [Allorhizocola rhizosphaerae]